MKYVVVVNIVYHYSVPYAAWLLKAFGIAACFLES